MIFLMTMRRTNTFSGAVEKLRQQVNRVNPIYWLVMNVYHGNYKFAKKRNIRVPQTSRKRKRGRRPPTRNVRGRQKMKSDLQAEASKELSKSEVEYLVKDMHHMIRKILDSQDMHPTLQEKKTTDQHSIHVGNFNGWNPYEEYPHMKNTKDHNSWSTAFDFNTPVGLKGDTMEDPFMAKLDSLLETIERIKKNPAYEGYQKEEIFTPSQRLYTVV